MLYSSPTIVVRVIVPVGTTQVGCIVEAITGVVGAVGAALIVTVAPGVATQALSAVNLASIVYVPATRPAKLAVVCQVAPPSILYSSPTTVVRVIVPVGTTQVGCIVEAITGVIGAVDEALIVTVAAGAASQLLSAVNRASII
jgi:uncharacterized membrane protein YeaQ/YmgE (transglycosylase-associated protein family)